jgi:hypothetical protein
MKLNIHRAKKKIDSSIIIDFNTPLQNE